jgi:hypothetical protein
VLYGRETNIITVGFEVLTALVRKSFIFWYTTPFSPLKFNQLFGGKFCLQPQNMKKEIRVKGVAFTVCYLLQAGFFLGFLFFDSEGRGDMLSETSIAFQRTIRHYIPEDRTLHYIQQFENKVIMKIHVFRLRKMS